MTPDVIPELTKFIWKDFSAILKKNAAFIFPRESIILK